MHTKQLVFQFLGGIIAGRLEEVDPNWNRVAVSKTNTKSILNADDHFDHSDYDVYTKMATLRGNPVFCVFVLESDKDNLKKLIDEDTW